MQLWIVPLDIPPTFARRCADLLDPPERERAARLATERLRTAHVAAHAALRGVLGTALCLAPGSLRFERGTHGKPFLDHEAGGTLHFNLSHTQGVALVALTRHAPVGVDIESLEEARVQLGDLQPALSPWEREALAATAPSQRTHAAYRCWVRKEALLKAAGCGITHGLDNFSVALGPRAHLRESRHPWLRAGHWSLRGFERPGHWTAAIALGSAMPKAIAVHHWHWSLHLQ